MQDTDLQSAWSEGARSKKKALCAWKSLGHSDFPRGLVRSQLVEEVAHLHADDQQKSQQEAVGEEANLGDCAEDELDVEVLEDV